MAEEIRMPPMGQTTGNLKILSWKKRAGDQVAQGETLLEVETDKATVEVESYASGTLLSVLSEEGEVVEVGTLIAYVGESGEEVPGKPEPVGQEAESEIAVDTMAVDTAAAGAPAAGTPAAGTPYPVAPGKVLASPVARKLAKDHGIRIADVKGSGPGGRIKKEDVLAHVSDAGEVAPPAMPAGKIGELSRHRKALGERLAHSFREIPHIYITSRIDMAEAARYISSTRAELGIRISYTHLILRAAAVALRREPNMNRILLEGGRVKSLAKSSIGLAVAGEDSLIVVTIPEPDRMSLAEVASYTREAVDRTRAGRLTGSDLSECALTISNLGMYGVDQFAAIIDPQQTAILAIGQISEEPVVRDGGFFARPMMTVTLSADHRVVDGVNGARYLAAFKEALERAVT